MALIKRPGIEPIQRQGQPGHGAASAAAQPPTAPLHVRLRPRTLAEVIGHDAVVRSLAGLLGSGAPPHSFLFTGPSGTGKTTIARIVGTMLGCSREGLIEIDAARFSGVDSMREVLLSSQFASLAANARKLYIIDEAHMLSKGAWNSMLLSLEEPPPHVFWALCTTEADRVPNTIRTRCHTFDLKPLKWELIANYLNQVVKVQGLAIAEGVVDVIARRSMGSPRQALVFASAVNGIAERSEALKLIDTVEEGEGEVIQFARMICMNRNFSMDSVRALLLRLSDESPEGIRLVVVNYATQMILSAKSMSDGEAQRLLAVIEAFSRPCGHSERQGPLLLAAGLLLFGG